MITNKYIVAIFSTDKITTGAHRRYKELISSLSKRGYKIVFFSPVDHYNGKIKGFTRISIDKKSFIPITFQLKKQVMKKADLKTMYKNSIVIVFGETATLAAMSLSEKIKSPLILGVRTNIIADRSLSISKEGVKLLGWKIKNKMVISLYLKIYAAYEMKMYNKASIITVQNSFDKEVVEGKVKNKKVEVIPNNINVPWIENKELKNSNNSKYVKRIGYIGSLIKRKGLIPLMEAYVNIAKEYPGIELHIAGEGPLKNEIINFMNMNGLTNIYLYGHVSDPMTFLSNIDLCVVPSIIDSFPNVVFEAWYVGTPVIGSNVGGIHYQLNDDRLLFEPNNSTEIFNKINDCLKPEYYYMIKKLSNKRKDNFIFDWTSKYEDIISLFDEQEGV